MYAASAGRCFYCGGPVVEHGNDLKRDWLFLRPAAVRMVREHVIPTIRGGSDADSNIVCGCANCNAIKSAFSGDEFRLIVGLRQGDLNYRFAGESPSEVRRDWLICHSSERFEREIVTHNMPSAAIGYDLRLRKASRRGRADA
jgi:hypothetical protein